MKSERMLELHRSKRAKGEWKGGGSPMFGFDRSAASEDPDTKRPRKITLRKNAAEAKVICEVRDRVLAGESIDRVTLDLNRRGILNKSGTRWKPSRLATLMVRPIIAGLSADGVTRLKDVPAIISADDHRALRARLPYAARGLDRQNGKAADELEQKAWYSHKVARLGNRRHPLVGFAFCAKCKKKLIGGPKLYRCEVSAGGCQKTNISTQGLEDYVLEQIAAHAGWEPVFSEEPSAFDAMFRALADSLHEAMSMRKVVFTGGEFIPADQVMVDGLDAGELRRDIGELLEKIEAMKADLAKRKPGAGYNAGLSLIDEWQSELEQKQAALATAAVVPADLPENVRKDFVADVLGAVQHMTRRWYTNQELTPEEIGYLHQAFGLVLERIEVKPKPKSSPIGSVDYDERITITWR